MSSRKRKPQGLIVEAVIQQMEESWNDSTREVARTDSFRVLEALMAEYGIEGAMAALDRQGFTASAYSYLLSPLYSEAMKRRNGVDSDCQI